MPEPPTIPRMVLVMRRVPGRHHPRTGMMRSSRARPSFSRPHGPLDARFAPPDDVPRRGRSSRMQMRFAPDLLLGEVEQSREHDEVDHHLEADPLSLVEMRLAPPPTRGGGAPAAFFPPLRRPP